MNNPVVSVIIAGAIVALISAFVVGFAFLALNRTSVIQMAEDDIEESTDTDPRMRLEKIRRRQSKLPVRYGRHPFEVCVVGSFLFSALSLAVFGPAPTASTQDLSQPTVVLLGISIALGSIVTLVGVFWKDAILSAFFEAGGLFGVAGPVTVYILSIMANVSNPSSALSAMSLVAIWAACIWRFVQITRWIRWLYRHPEPLRADPTPGEADE